ncbi:putative acid phosphatase [Phaeomoniella chlamydospora]|uniref:Putative acid phosphatase n=1 Tax=Phaeomoniella chlamydospora TaxID=158046 RepID=A0A0G2GME7_PHACM|nr:putative acid phosphatase [Phaeomoniella chlamydospora]
MVPSFKLAALAALTGIALAIPGKPGKPGKQAPTSSIDWADYYTATSTAAVYAAQATAKTSSPTSNVKGKAFDRFVVIWLENTDYDMAVADPNLAWLATKGITLSNYFGTTHPSEPNYAAAISGDNFGMDNDNFNQFPANISTVIDLLEARGISWGEYQEDMPYSGFEGFSFVNQKTGANDYVRKHNPAILYNANADSSQRLSQMKNLTMFYEDLKNDQLPQWMFITPNMTSDGHDTSVTVAGTWTRNFLSPLLANKNFMKNTLVLVTFDENETYTIQNRILGILLGDSIPTHLHGTTDSNFYSHYSEISTVEANWDLNTLGRWDVGANVFEFVAKFTCDKLSAWPAATSATGYSVFLNQSYNGFMSAGDYATYKDEIPAPNLATIRNGRTVLPEVVLNWARSELESGSYYENTVEIPDGLRPPKNWD